MYHQLGPDVVLSTTTEEEETTEEKETTGKFFAKPCFVTILSLQFHPLLSILSAIFFCFTFRRANHNDNENRMHRRLRPELRKLRCEQPRLR